MFDIHCHILHGVDDGSGNLSDSLEMAKLAADSGTKAIIATPHCNIPATFDNYWSKDIETKFSALRQAVRECGIPVEIYKGQEVFLSKKFEEHLEKGEFITLNDSRYMLVELDFRIDEETAVSRIGRLVSHGYVPIIAHPERYSCVIGDTEAVEKFREAGALIQVNGGSLTGYFGNVIQKTAQRILFKGQADFVASDAHSQYRRTPDMTAVHEFICENCSYDYADILMNINPLKVLNNEII